MRLLPGHRRRDMFALYGFCRAVDDIADGSDPAEIRAARLSAIRGAVAAFYETGHCLSPVLAPLVPAIRRHGLPRAELDLLFDGMETDVNAPLTAPAGQELSLYCRQVAGTVGILAVHILGRRDAGDFAVLTAEALQLTNILRDLDEDCDRGRLYLPAEILARCAIDPCGPRGVLTHPRLDQACRMLADIAERRFAAATAELSRIGRRRLWPAIAMLATYHALLGRLRRRGWSDRRVPSRLGTAHKVWIVVRTAAIGR